MIVIKNMTLASARQRPITSAIAGSGVAGCDLAPCRECQNRHTHATNLELSNARADYGNRTESLRPMTETTAFWVILGWPYKRQVRSGDQPLHPLQ